MSRRRHKNNQGNQRDQRNLGNQQYKPGEFKIKRAKLEVTKVFDGDTIKGKILIPGWFGTKSIETVVQLLAVNTPDLHVTESGKEPEDYAIEAMSMAKKLNGKTVPIEFAVTRAGNFLIRESKINSTRWNEQRLPAIVYPKRGKESLNEQLARAGYARVKKNNEWITPDFAKKLIEATEDAKKRRRGIWEDNKNERVEFIGVPNEKVLVYCLLSFLAGLLTAIGGLILLAGL